MIFTITLDEISVTWKEITKRDHKKEITLCDLIRSHFVLYIDHKV